MVQKQATFEAINRKKQKLADTYYMSVVFRQQQASVALTANERPETGERLFVRLPEECGHSVGRIRNGCLINPFSTAVPIWGQTSLIPSELSP